MTRHGLRVAVAAFGIAGCAGGAPAPSPDPGAVGPGPRGATVAAVSDSVGAPIAAAPDSAGTAVMPGSESSGPAVSPGPDSTRTRVAPAPVLPEEAVRFLEVEAACDSVLAFLDDLPGTSISRGPATFDDRVLGAPRRGCCVEIAGSFAALGSDMSPPDDLRAFLRERSWLEDPRYGADGPDGTAYAMIRGSVILCVDGEWDGGDDADSTYVPGDAYTLRVCCAPLRPPP